MNSNRFGKNLEGSGPDSIRRIIQALYWTEVPGYKTRIIINYYSEYELELSFELNTQIAWQKSTRIQYVSFRTGESTYCGLYHDVKVIGGCQRAAAINSAECGDSTLLLQPPTRQHGCLMQKAILTISFLNSIWPTWHPVNQPLQSLASCRGGRVWSQSSWCGICGEQDCSVQVILRKLRL